MENRPMSKKIYLKYNNNIYPKYAIKEALSNYKKIAKAVFSEKNKYYQIEISEYQQELEGYIGDEFSNHILGLIGR
jgi:hypothetical protein